MRPLFIALLPFAVLGWSPLPAGFPSMECPTPTVAQAFDASTAVFVGKVTSQRALKTASVSGVETETTFEVTQLWKGAPERGQIQLRHFGGVIGDTEITCDETFQFTVGDEYVVFARGKPLTTNTCQPTRKVSDAKELLRWLAANAHKR
jgi:hypothetical protein